MLFNHFLSFIVLADTRSLEAVFKGARMSQQEIRLIQLKVFAFSCAVLSVLACLLVKTCGMQSKRVWGNAAFSEVNVREL